MVFGENPEHLYLCAYYSAFLTISSLRGLAQSLEETTEHRRGCCPPAPERSEEPPVVVRQQKKPRRGDRVLNMLSTNQLDVLSPLWGFRLLMFLYRGFAPPSVFFRTSSAFPRTLIIIKQTLRKAKVNRRAVFGRVQEGGACVNVAKLPSPRHLSTYCIVIQ